MSERSTTPNDRKGRAVFSAVSEERCLKPSRHSESSQPIRNGWSNANRRLKELGLNDSQLDQLKAFSADEIEHVVDLAAHMTFEQTRQAVSDARGMTPELRKTFFLRKQTNPNLTTTNFLVEQYLVQQEQARFQQVRADDAQQNADELKAIFCQSTTTLLTNDQKYKEAYQKWKEEYRGHVPTVENVYEQFKFELVVGEVSRTTQANENSGPLRLSPSQLAEYPSHMHIDLLQHAQGRGFGPIMVNRLLDALRGAGSTGIHLCMSAVNHRAYGFYKKLGFHIEVKGESEWIMARKL